MRQEDHKEAAAMIQTLSEALAEREARGEARGKITATREAIILLAQSLHQEIPDHFRASLDEITDLRRLYEILEAVPRVDSLEELLP